MLKDPRVMLGSVADYSKNEALLPLAPSKVTALCALYKKIDKIPPRMSNFNSVASQSEMF